MAKSSTSKSSTTTSKNTSGTVSNGTYVLSASQKAAAEAQIAKNASAAKGTTVANDTGSKTNGTVTTYNPTAAKTSGTVSNGTYQLSASQQSAANSQKAMNAAAKAGTTVANDTGSATNGTVKTYTPTTTGKTSVSINPNNTVSNGNTSGTLVNNAYVLSPTQKEAALNQYYLNSQAPVGSEVANDAGNTSAYLKALAQQKANTVYNNEEPSYTNDVKIVHNPDGSKVVYPNQYDDTESYPITAAQMDAANKAYTANLDNYGVTTNPYSYWETLVNAYNNYDENGNYIYSDIVDPEKDKQVIKNYDISALLGANLDTQLSYEELYGTDYYTNMYDTISEILNQYGDTMSDELKAALESQLAKINAQFDEAARQYYIQYRTQMANMPEYLSRLGVTGGMSETAALGALNNYSSNLTSSENERFSTLADVDTSYRQKIAENNQEVANQLANYYYQIQMQKLKNQREDEQLAYERQQAANELAYKYAALAANSF